MPSLMATKPASARTIFMRTHSARTNMMCTFLFLLSYFTYSMNMIFWRGKNDLIEFGLKNGLVTCRS